MKKIFTILSIAAVSLVSAQNLIPNNGFETWTSGKPDGWFIPTAATIAQSSTAHSGSSSLSLTSPASGNSTVSPTTDTPVTAGTTYVFQVGILITLLLQDLSIGINSEIQRIQVLIICKLQIIRQIPHLGNFSQQKHNLMLVQQLQDRV
jgi:hypothetical protein